MAASSAAVQRDLERAMLHQRANELPQAEKLYRRVLAAEPRHPTVLHLLGALLLQLDRDDEAVRLLESAVRHAPTHALFLANLGEAYRRKRRYEEASAVLRRAVASRPDLAEARYTLGLVLDALGRREDAVGAYRDATLLKPQLLKPHVRLAATLQHLGRLDEALAACRRGLEIDASCPDLHSWMGGALRDLGLVEEALAALETAVRLDPEFFPAHSSLVYALALDPRREPHDIVGEARRWAERHAASLAAERATHDNDRDPERVLRIGYVSPHYYNHCHCLFLLPLFRHHDRGRVEVHAYGSVERPDEITERVRAEVDHFCDASDMTDAALAARIRADRIDILVDLAMHLAGSRLLVFARKPAPVQATWLAYPGTTGLDAIDYRLTDVHLDPPGAPESGAYVEQSVHLPETFWCYDPESEPIEVGAPPVLRNGYVTFGCLNNIIKTNAPVFSAWAEILRATPRSRLALVARPGSSRDRVRGLFSSEGIDPERVSFADFVPRLRYLESYRGIDVGLDTFPHNGGTTTLDANWMGVPVVTLVGKTVVGRAGLSIASNLGATDLVARSAKDYVRIAVELASDVPRLTRLRAELRPRLQASPLMDAPRFARHLEAAYRHMWRAFCACDPICAGS